MNWATIERLKYLDEEVSRLYAVTTELSDEIDSLRALNAELMAAMENLLRRYTKYLIDQGNHDKVILIATEEARAAIAKAKGES